MKKQNLKRLTVSAVMIALATVLSLAKIWTMPLGGSVTLLSMLPIVLISAMYGTGWGLFSSFIYSLTQIALGLAELMTWGMDVRMWIGSLTFDYLVAFTVIGLAGIFRKKGTVGICLGTALALTLRFISHFISGCIFFDVWSPWDNPYIYSICYNGAYMLPELIFTIVAAVLIFRFSSIRKLTDM